MAAGRRPMFGEQQRFMLFLIAPAALLLLLTGSWRGDPARRIVLLAYASYLLPYIMISYYERYEAPLIGLKCLLCFWAWDVACELGEKLRRARLEEEVAAAT